MKHEFALESWQDDGWFVGRLKEVPDVFSQGETSAELESNIAGAPPGRIQHKPLLLDVA